MIIIMDLPTEPQEPGLGPEPELDREPERPPGRVTGAALRGRAQGARTDQMGAALAQLDPDLLRWADTFIFEDVWDTDRLAFEERMLVAIVALATSGQQAQLRNYLHGALQAGIDPDRIGESLKMLVVYVGFPAAIAALATFREIRGKYEKPVG